MAKNTNTATKSNTNKEPAKAKAAPAAGGKAKRTRVKGMKTSKDVQIALMFDGIDAVQEMYNTKKCSRTTLKRALSELQAQGRSGEAIDQLAEFVKPLAGTGTRGRAPIAAGELRQLKAQKVKNSGLFLRLPLASIPDADKGSLFDVKVSNDGKTITVCLHIEG